MAEAFISRPTEVYREYLRARKRPVGFQEGRLAMALEIITARKSLQAVGMLGAGAVSMLDSLLADQNLLDTAEMLYEELNEWRKPRFVPSVEDPSADATPSRSRRGTLGSPTWRLRGRRKPPSS